MINYNRINNLVGWIVFFIACFTYISTIEPTGSFWDCGEFIATAHKLEVGHPPGAPLFLMLARVFIVLAGDNVLLYPIMVNIMSALMSAFTILFLFWTITALAKKIVIAKAEVNTEKVLAVMGAGLVGALAYCWSDSFWFSAVEGEVYASSSFFTAIVFWAMLKWENVADEKHSARWIVLIAYLMGLSIGVHLLNLLTIPALAFVYYFRKYEKTTTKGLIYTFLISCVILLFVQIGVIQGMVTLSAQFDLLFVNTFGLPFGSGIIFYAIVIISAIVYGIMYTRKKQMHMWNTALVSLAFILIGYSSFAQIFIRSLANPPLDENNPENAFNFVSYLNREQYGDFPILSGQYYNAKVIDQKEGSMQWAKVEGEKKYVEAGPKIKPVYDPNYTTLFPRMWSNQPQHIAEYKKWCNIKSDTKKPDFFSDNLYFFFRYQVGEMYMRYFMWNFTGRQNDIQGPGGITKGNWISGINFVDEMRLGKQDKLPLSMKNNKGRNTYFFLPLVLGILGLVYHFNKDKRDAGVVAFLFLMTGLAIIVYLNGPPLQPRERDYAYVGSFYAFAIWIGFGALAIYNFLKNKINGTTAAAVAAVACVAVPARMVSQNWDDHNRSYRYTSRDFATDYLNSCAPNAIIFTNGDNDTFPLWYAQEVEGVRTDVRVVNLSLLNTDWYIDQLKRKYYTSEPLPISWGSDKYSMGKRDYIPFYDRNLPQPIELKELVDFMGSDEQQAKARTNGGEEVNYYPSRNFKITIDSAAVISTGTVAAKDADKIVKEMTWSVDGNYLLKNNLMILNILANNNWKRPVYFATTVGNDNYLNLEPYFQLEGLAYRVVPIKTNSNSQMVPGRVETDVMYKNVMEKFKWGNMKDDRVYLDENNLRMTTNFRINFSRLSEELLAAGRRDEAIKVLDKCVEEMPDKQVPYNYFMTKIAELYYRSAGEMRSPMDTTMNLTPELSDSKQLIDKANAITNRVAEIYADNLEYYISLKGTKEFKFVESDAQQALFIMQTLVNTLKQTKQKDLATKIEKQFNDLAQRAGI